ncbi:MAG TPA: histidine kinase [Ferruginibacter sp.]|nr:histidine kinase [Chitinophagaceae bacterium]MBK9530234.1 histidine kinase [Chitinophagaceae bacterium]HQW92982.1 histidine kinase [Ferruginibacter sp.]
MKWVWPNRVEWISFFVLMPFIAAGCSFVLFGKNWYSTANLWVYGFLFMMGVGLLIWYFDVILTRYIHDTFAAYRDILKRIIALVVKQAIMIGISNSIFIAGIMQMPLAQFQAGSTEFWMCYGIALGITLIAMVIWEGDFIFQQWKESLTENEKYTQLSLQGEFDMLKSQVNPHFLFNCFNTLSSLITEDKHRAEVFLNELSKVYRYLLRNNENGMSTLKNEIRFIRSYYELLKTRHGDAIQLQIETDKRYDDYLLPSLSLQMLVENAVKHNALSKSLPLQIEVFTTVGNKLVVNNSIRQRAQKAPSGEVGLKNIRQKYALLNQAGFQVMNDGKQFTAVLPLIWDKLMITNSINQKPKTASL